MVLSEKANDAYHGRHATNTGRVLIRATLMLLCLAAFLTYTNIRNVNTNYLINHRTKNGNQQRNRGSATPAPAMAKTGDVFLPGSLKLTIHETYSKCYVDPARYKHHFKTRANRLGRAEQGLIYAQIPKAGSSTVRAKMQKAFGPEKIHVCNSTLLESARVFTFVREPSSRFVSCFQEMLKRWRKGRESERPPEEYKEFAQHYSHIDLDKDHDVVLEALEEFLKIYDAYQVPNTHLATQITYILRPNCALVDEIYNLEDFDSVFGGFLAERGMNNTDDIISNRKTLRLEVYRVSLDAKRKMCQMSAIDYCCLNFELPPECEGAVTCRWIEVTHEEKEAMTLQRESEERNNTSSSNDTVLMIEPISPYPILPPSK